MASVLSACASCLERAKKALAKNQGMTGTIRFVSGLPVSGGLIGPSPCMACQVRNGISVQQHPDLALHMKEKICNLKVCIVNVCHFRLYIAKEQWITRHCPLESQRTIALFPCWIFLSSYGLRSSP
ncbi:MAG: hypothetical protein ACK4GC_09915 [Paracoccaceae bacterium]